MLAGARNEVIDGFRGVAVLSVMTFHYLNRWSQELGALDGHGDWFAVGQLGVDLFFVISGLVITMTMLHSSDAIEFVVKRFARLYPAFIVAASLIFSLLALANPMHRNVGLPDYLANWTMLAGDLGFQYVDGVFWTLAVELKFYFFVAVAFIVLGRHGFWMGLVVVAALGSLASGMSRLVADHIFIARYMPFFLLGAGAWYAIVERHRNAGIILALAAAATYAIQFQANTPDDVPLWLAQIYLVTTIGLLIVLLRFAPTLNLGPLARVGRISYSLYLVHQSLGVTTIALLMARGWAQEVAISAATATSFISAWILFRCVELPGQRMIMRAYRSWGDRLRGRHRALLM